MAPYTTLEIAPVDMPNDASGKPEPKKESGDKRKAKPKEAERPRSSGRSTPSETTEQYHTSCVDSHAGYLAPAIKGLAKSLQTNILTISIAIAIILIVIHLSLPIFMTPHFSSLITLLIPAQSTIRWIKVSLHMPNPPSSKRPEPENKDGKDEMRKWTVKEKKRKQDEAAYNRAKKVKEGGPQWMWFWLVYVILNGCRGLVGIYRPGWKGWFELWRSVMLVVVGGPWFARGALQAVV